MQGKKHSKVGHLTSIFDAAGGYFLPKTPPQGRLSILGWGLMPLRHLLQNIRDKRFANRHPSPTRASAREGADCSCPEGRLKTKPQPSRNKKRSSESPEKGFSDGLVPCAPFRSCGSGGSLCRAGCLSIGFCRHRASGSGRWRARGGSAGRRRRCRACGRSRGGSGSCRHRAARR